MFVLHFIFYDLKCTSCIMKSLMEHDKSWLIMISLNIFDNFPRILVSLLTPRNHTPFYFKLNFFKTVKSVIFKISSRQ